jgi:hypothetical protein
MAIAREVVIGRSRINRSLSGIKKNIFYLTKFKTKSEVASQAIINKMVQEEDEKTRYQLRPVT